MNHRAAFTLAEILAALVFLAVLLPAVFEGVTYATRAAEIAERQAVATELAQTKLAELTLDDTWTSADSSGDFGADWPGYRWQSTQTSWDNDSAMTVLSVQAYFPIRGREQSVTLSTLVSASTSALTTSTASSSSSSSTSGTNRSSSR